MPKQRNETKPKNEPKTIQVAFRLEPSLVARLDRHAKRMAERTPGLSYTRVDAVKALLTKALAEEEGKDRG